MDGTTTALITAGVSVGATLLGRYVWDRWQAPERLGRESRSADADLRTWMEGQLRELRAWLETQFAQGREHFARHDSRIAQLETKTEVTRQLCELRHAGKRVSDPPGFDPAASRCGGGTRTPGDP